MLLCACLLFGYVLFGTYMSCLLCFCRYLYAGARFGDALGNRPGLAFFVGRDVGVRVRSFELPSSALFCFAHVVLPVTLCCTVVGWRSAGSWRVRFTLRRAAQHTVHPPHPRPRPYHTVPSATPRAGRQRTAPEHARNPASGSARDRYSASIGDVSGTLPIRSGRAAVSRFGFLRWEGCSSQRSPSSFPSKSIELQPSQSHRKSACDGK